MSQGARSRAGLAAAFHEAREALAVEPGADAIAIKRAWRRAAAQHPPDRDPDGFRAVREAFELLADPVKHAQEMLAQPIAAAPMPEVPELPPPPPPHALAVELLRVIIGRLPLADLRPARSVPRAGTPQEGSS